MTTTPKGPRFVAYFGPVLDALRDLGSSAKPQEVYAWVAEHVDVPKALTEETTKGGQSKFENVVGWSRFYLTKAGYLASEERGVWILTDKGRETHLDYAAAYAVFKEVREAYAKPSPRKPKGKGAASKPAAAALDPDASALDEAEDTAPDDRVFLNEDEIREQLINTLQNEISDSGFEELSARLLRHIGFEQVRVSGGSGDRGVDGEGQLTINRFVRTKVMFQCKRYVNAVTPDKIRDFRGAIQGRAERGIFLTTATFTKGAREEAARENATPIELVDIDRLLDLLIEEGLGVRETKALVIEDGFFRPYSRKGTGE